MQNRSKGIVKSPVLVWIWRSRPSKIGLLSPKEQDIVPYKFQPGKLYRMPTHFGPSPGPRQDEGGHKFDNRDSPKTTTVSVSYLTNRQQLDALLPERFEVGADPVVTVSASYMKEIPWLAGRGYNTLGVSFPAVFRGQRDQATGSFLLVL